MANIKDFQTINVTTENTVTIPNGTIQSNIFSLGRTSLCSFIVDEYLSGMTLNFSVGINTDPLLAPLYDGDAIPALVSFVLPPIILGVGQHVAVPVSPALFTGFQFIKIVTSAPVAADSIVQLGLRPI